MWLIYQQIKTHRINKAFRPLICPYVDGKCPILSVSAMPSMHDV